MCQDEEENRFFASSNHSLWILQTSFSHLIHIWPCYHLLPFLFFLPFRLVKIFQGHPYFLQFFLPLFTFLLPSLTPPYILNIFRPITIRSLVLYLRQKMKLVFTCPSNVFKSNVCIEIIYPYLAMAWTFGNIPQQSC